MFTLHILCYLSPQGPSSLAGRIGQHLMAQWLRQVPENDRRHVLGAFAAVQHAAALTQAPPDAIELALELLRDVCPENQTNVLQILAITRQCQLWRARETQGNQRACTACSEARPQLRCFVAYTFLATFAEP